MTKSNLLIGCDENGTGSLIHCLVVTAVKAPPTWAILNIRDSKKLSRHQRNEIVEALKQEKQLGNIDYLTLERSSNEIDSISMYKCLKSAYKELILKIYDNEEVIIIDGNMKFDDAELINLPIQSIIKADDKFLTVSAASIIGKVHRDNQIIELSKQFPEYKWEKNMGYASKDHKEAIKKFGLTEHHRKSYKINV